MGARNQTSLHDLQRLWIRCGKSSIGVDMNKILRSAILIIGITGIAFLIGIVQSSMTGTTFYDPAGLYP